MKKQFAAFTLLILASAVPAVADTVSGTVTGGTAQTAGGTFVLLTPPLANPYGPPDSVGNDNFQSPDLFTFDEQQNVTLTNPLVVDVGGSPIAAGTVISSQYVFFDPGPIEEMIGTVTFDSTVLGIITSNADLAASDFLSNPDVNYLNPADRGLEAGESVTMGGTDQIQWDTISSSPGDYVRVITAVKPATSMPEPPSLLLLGVGLLSLGFIFGRR
jgi:hypothetical protein